MQAIFFNEFTKKITIDLDSLLLFMFASTTHWYGYPLDIKSRKGDFLGNTQFSMSHRYDQSWCCIIRDYDPKENWMVHGILK